MQLNKIILLAISVHFTSNSVAQELNFGVHLNPTLTAPLPGNSVHDNEIRMTSFNPGYNVGVNAKIQWDGFNLESGINVIQKKVQFKQKTEHSALTNNGSVYKMNYNNTAVEIPLIAAATIHRHEKKLIYNVDILAGISYELFMMDGTSESSQSGAGSYGSINSQNTKAPIFLDNQHWFNAILGFNIHTIFNHFGLIEYGVAYHLPLKEAEPYQVSTNLTDNYGNQRPYSGEFTPKVSYIDFKLCYYFLNYKSQKGRVLYRL